MLCRRILLLPKVCRGVKHEARVRNKRSAIYIECVKIAELYRLTSPSNKQYIGIAKNGLQSRFTVHVSEAKSGSMTALHKAIRKYGPDAFVKEILVVSD